MSKEVLILTTIGALAILTLLSTTALSRFGAILSPPLTVANVWALNVTGTEGPDTLKGTADKDIIRGYGGDDIISGFSGNDGIRGGRGDDTIHGDEGKDRIRGDSGNDVIFGDDGNDLLIAGPGDDKLTGGPGKDTFNCGEGNDTVVDVDQVVNDTVMASCENTSSSSSAPSKTSSVDINASTG